MSVRPGKLLAVIGPVGAGKVRFWKKKIIQKSESKSSFSLLIGPLSFACLFSMVIIMINALSKK